MNDQVISPDNFVTDIVRFSYAHVFEARANKKGVLKYSACLLLDKKNVKELANWKACIEQAILKGIKKGLFTAAQRSLYKLPIRDGDKEITMGIKKPGEGYEGMWFINANSDDAPAVDKPQGGKSVPVLDKNEFYSGVLGRAIISFFPFGGEKAEGGRGVGVGLNGCFKVKDAPRLDNRVDASSVFAQYAAGMGEVEEVDEDMIEDVPDKDFG